MIKVKKIAIRLDPEFPKKTLFFKLKNMNINRLAKKVISIKSKLDLLIIIIEIQNKAMLESKPFAPSKKFIVLKKIKKHKNVKNIELFDKSICLLGILNNSKVVNTKF